MSNMIASSLPLLLEGLWITLLLSVAAIIGSTLLGLLAAVLRTSRVSVASHIAVLYTELFRGTPVLITLMFIYFGVAYFGYEINLFAAGILGLSIYQGAYIAEVFRAGIEPCPKDNGKCRGSSGYQNARPFLA
jgi:polar amino acid transport system permease protein